MVMEEHVKNKLKTNMIAISHFPSFKFFFWM